jgi:hypothetical protein
VVCVDQKQDCSILPRTNNPEMKNMQATKKLSLNSTTKSKPSQRILSPWPDLLRLVSAASFLAEAKSEAVR